MKQETEELSEVQKWLLRLLDSDEFKAHQIKARKEFEEMFSEIIADRVDLRVYAKKKKEGE